MKKYYWATIVLLSIVLIIFAFVSGPSQQNSSENTVTWEEAIRILNSGQVKSAYQSHNLNVTLVLKDGTRVNAQEPNIGDIFDEIRKCGDPCKYITTATE